MIKKIYKVDSSAGKSIFSQRNNQVRPGVSCNVTSMIMMLDYAHIRFPSGTFKQPEDNLLTFLLSDKRVEEYYKEVAPTDYTKYIQTGRDPELSFPPNEVHTVLSFGTNLWIGKQITKFYGELPVQELMYRTTIGQSCVISGEFAGLHHVVVLVGFNTTQDPATIQKIEDVDLTQIQSVILDDPYGDYRSGYKIQIGNGVEMPWVAFISQVKPQKNALVKRAHIVTT